MVDLKAPEKKLLSEECWIDLANDVKIRIDYPTRSQEVELRRLQKIWFHDKQQPDTEHWMTAYLRATIKDAVGFSIEGKPAILIVERGLAKELTCDKDSKNPQDHLDLIATFIELDLVEAIGGLIMSRLEMTDVEKKTLPSPPNSSKTANSVPTGNRSNQEPVSLTAGIPSPQMAERTLLKRTLSKLFGGKSKSSVLV